MYSCGKSGKNEFGEAQGKAHLPGAVSIDGTELQVSVWRFDHTVHSVHLWSEPNWHLAASSASSCHLREA